MTASNSHSEMEKIKILYEGSLKDIRDLTDKLEGIAEKIASASSAVNMAEAEALARVSSEIGSLVSKIENQQERVDNLVDNFSIRVEKSLESATTIRAGITGIHETFLEGQVRKIVLCVAEINSIKQSIVKEATEEISEPLVNKLIGHYQTLIDFEKSSARFMGEIKGLQEQIAVDQRSADKSKIFMLLIGFFAVLIAFATGLFFG